MIIATSGWSVGKAVKYVPLNVVFWALCPTSFNPLALFSMT